MTRLEAVSRLFGRVMRFLVRSLGFLPPIRPCDKFLIGTYSPLCLFMVDGFSAPFLLVTHARGRF